MASKSEIFKHIQITVFNIYIVLGFMDFRIICVSQSMKINGSSSCRQLKPHSLKKLTASSDSSSIRVKLKCIQKFS